MTKLSLIVCNYNNGKYFENSLQSILNQTYKDFEVIVIDDCSTDNSAEVIRKLIEPHTNFKLFINEQNLGYSGSLHLGIMNAKSPYVARLDPDDALFPTAIEESLKMIQENDFIATYSQIMLCDDKMKPQSIYPRSREIKNGNKYFFNINNEVSHFFTFKKEAYLKTEGINPELTSSVDFDLYLKLYEVGEFKFIKKPLYYYRQHPGGISQNKNRKETIHQNWNQVLFDTCKRRGIDRIGNHFVDSPEDLAKVIFKWENNFFKKFKNKLLDL